MTTWNQIIKEEAEKEYFVALQDFVSKERKEKIIYPPQDAVYTAFELTPFESVQVVIIGQDPYHQPNQAMGLAFSVKKGQPLPKSLINIFKELKSDLGIENKSGNLVPWAKQGVFMMNTLMSVEESKPLSHQGMGWEIFTDRILKELGQREDPIIFVLWGKKAQDKSIFIAPHHYIIASSHPSPLSAYRSFWNSKPFSQINRLLKQQGKPEIDWRTYV